MNCHLVLRQLNGSLDIPQSVASYPLCSSFSTYWQTECLQISHNSHQLCLEYHTADTATPSLSLPLNAPHGLLSTLQGLINKSELQADPNLCGAEGTIRNYNSAVDHLQTSRQDISPDKEGVKFNSVFNSLRNTLYYFKKKEI